MEHRTRSPSEIRAELDSPKFCEMFPQLVGYVMSRMRHARRREPTPAEVEDMVQDVVEAALRGREWPENFGLWQYLCGVAWNVIYDNNRAERRRREAAVAVPFDEAAEPPAPASRRAQRIDAWGCIGAIKAEVAPDRALSALVAAVLDGNEKYSEIAEALGCDEAQVDLLFRRLRRRIDAAGLHLGSEDD